MGHRDAHGWIPVQISRGGYIFSVPDPFEWVFSLWIRFSLYLGAVPLKYRSAWVNRDISEYISGADPGGGGPGGQDPPLLGDPQTS